MLDDLTKEIKAQLYERVKSPLFGAFALSWVGWNYRGLLVVISDMPFKEKMAYLDGLYPSVEAWGWHCFAWPLLTAVGFLLIYPWPGRWMYSYWAWQQKELKKVQQRIEDEIPMTREEAKALRKASLEQVAGLEAQILGQRQLNSELNERLRVASEEAGRLIKERDQFAEAAKKSSEELMQHMAEVVHNASESNTEGALNAMARVTQESSNAPFAYQPVGHPLPKSPSEFLTAYEHSKKAKLGEASAGVFDALCRLGGATTDEIAGVANLEAAEAHEILLRLVRDGRVIRNGDSWGLSAIGKAEKAATSAWL